MNKLITTEQGGHPLTLDDLGFLQTAYSEAFNNILVGLDKANGLGYKLYGAEAYLEPATGTIWLTEGAVVLRVGPLAEVFYVATHNTGIPEANFSNPYWRDAISNVAPSPVVYKNLSTKNVHKQRRLTLGVTGNNLLYPRYNDVVAFTTVLSQKLKPSEFSALTTGSYASGYSGNIRHIEEIHGWVTVDGFVSKSGSAANNETMFTLPSGRRPSTNRLHILAGTGGAQSDSVVEINTNGTVVLVQGAANAFSIHFPSIRFPKF